MCALKTRACTLLTPAISAVRSSVFGESYPTGTIFRGSTPYSGDRECASYKPKVFSGPAVSEVVRIEKNRCNLTLAEEATQPSCRTRREASRLLLVVLVRAALGRTHEYSRDSFLTRNSIPGTARIDLYRVFSLERSPASWNSNHQPHSTARC